MKKIITSISLSSLLIFSVYSSEESQITQLLQKGPSSSDSSKSSFLSSIKNMPTTEQIVIAAAVVGGLTTLIYYYLKTDNTSDSEDKSPSKTPVKDQKTSGLDTAILNPIYSKNTAIPETTNKIEETNNEQALDENNTIKSYGNVTTTRLKSNNNSVPEDYLSSTTTTNCAITKEHNKLEEINETKNTTTKKTTYKKITNEENPLNKFTDIGNLNTHSNTSLNPNNAEITNKDGINQLAIQESTYLDKLEKCRTESTKLNEKKPLDKSTNIKACLISLNDPEQYLIIEDYLSSITWKNPNLTTDHDDLEMTDKTRNTKINNTTNQIQPQKEKMVTPEEANEFIFNEKHTLQLCEEVINQLKINNLTYLEKLKKCKIASNDLELNYSRSSCLDLITETIIPTRITNLENYIAASNANIKKIEESLNEINSESNSNNP